MSSNNADCVCPSNSVALLLWLAYRSTICGGNGLIIYWCSGWIVGETWETESVLPLVQAACRCTLQRCLKGRPRKLNNQTAQSLSCDVTLLPASVMKCKANPQSTVSVDQIGALKTLKGLGLPPPLCRWFWRTTETYPDVSKYLGASIFREC